MATLRSVRGMNDLFAADLNSFRQIERELQKVFNIFGYQEIRTPILEELALFKRGVGETTDIVEKEMFVVNDGEHTYCLRPENTAAVVRALIEKGGISEDTQEKLYYLGPMFRKERPQKGRLRQFHQFGVEIFGIKEPAADIEVIAMVDQLFKSLNLSGITLKINSLGSNSERLQYRKVLEQFLLKHKSELCEDCQRRIETNPLRVLDCKKPKCQEVVSNAPKVIDALGEESRKHFDEVLLGLKALGVLYVIDQQLVRGLDYYNQTVFEFVADIGLGAQNAVAAGGRYDGLFLTLGSKVDLPAIGCAGGIERIALLLESGEKKDESIPAITFIAADDAGEKLVLDLAFRLRRAGVAADFCLSKKSIKAQMRRADRLGSRNIAVLGESEALNKTMRIKNMQNKSEEEVAIDSRIVADFLKNN